METLNKNRIMKFIERIKSRSDDMFWKIPTATDYNFRNDMFYPSGAIHFWSNGHSFKVGESLSSTDVFLVKN